MICNLLQEYKDNDIAQEAIRLIHYTNESVFLTGKAGTGKSTLLQKLIGAINKNYIVLAPTGIAALNVKGQTLHSFFQFEQRPFLPYDKDIKYLPIKEELIKKLDLVIIDEISMVRCDLMNAVDLSLQKNSGNRRPFGGKQLLLIGDLFQLPPVIDNKKIQELEILNKNYSSPYFFSAKAFENGFKLNLIELEKVYRQKDKEFIELLNCVRDNSITFNHLTFLNKRYNPTYSPSGNSVEIILATTNAIVKSTNQNRLNQLNGNLKEFIATTTGNFNNEVSESKLPAEKKLYLKEQAQVMFIKNDNEKRWVNGSLGTVISISNNSINVKIDSSGNIYTVDRVTWESYDYVWNKEEEKVEKIITGTFTQFPIKLAWSVTIHKSQGQTFDKIVIDLGTGAFATGQTYVALSRCRSFEGIILKTKVNHSDIKVDDRIKRYLESNINSSMDKERYDIIVNSMQETINTIDSQAITLKSKILDVERSKKYLEQKLNYYEVKTKELENENQKLKNEITAIRKLNSLKNWWIFGLTIIAVILIVLISKSFFPFESPQELE